MHDFLVEIHTEELPPKSLQRLATHFLQEITNQLIKFELTFRAANFLATPRRLTVFVQQLSSEQPTSVIERKGPAVTAAYDQQGHPTPACLGFARSCGITPDQLEKTITPQGEWVSYKQTVIGKSTTTLLPTIVQQALAALPIPKRMRWGDQIVEFIRPVHSVILLYGNDVIPAEILGLKTGRKTRGHRFHSPDWVDIPHPAQYLEILEKHFVLADFEQRKRKIRDLILNTVTHLSETVKQPLQAVIHEPLLDEVTGLVEWPVALCGSFDAEFLMVPQEALISAMQDHQRYFPIENDQSKLQPYFITLSNIESKDPAQVIAGNERVLRARLADAKFFFDSDVTYFKPLYDALAKSTQDVLVESEQNTLTKSKQDMIAEARQNTLAKSKQDMIAETGKNTLAQSEQADDTQDIPAFDNEIFSLLHKNLKPVIYINKLGTLWDKSIRLSLLSSFIAEKMKQSSRSITLAKWAGLLAKFDLTSQLVGEFPELQGIAGSYYVNGGHLNKHTSISRAIRRQYFARFKNALPDVGVTCALAIADRVDMLVGLFGIHQVPTGDKDPLGMRRAALSILRIMIEEKCDCDLRELIQESIAIYKNNNFLLENLHLADSVLQFIFERLKPWYQEQHISADVYAAVASLNINRPYDFHCRILAVQAFKQLPEAEALSSANKRVSNILSKYNGSIAGHSINTDLFEEEAEYQLAHKLTAEQNAIADLSHAEKYADILTRLATLREPVDCFFDKVLVMTDDTPRRENRLLLLKQLRELFLHVADIALLQ